MNTYPRSNSGHQDYSIYEGKRLRGWPVLTISRGEIIMKDGEFLGKRGQGRFIRRRLD